MKSVFVGRKHMFLVLLFAGASLLPLAGESDSETGVLPQWYTDRYWTATENQLAYNGAAKDSVAWFAVQPGQLHTEIDFDVTLLQRNGTDPVEFIFLLYGSGEIDTNDPWSKGLVINYKYADDSAEAHVRKNGIYSATGVIYLYSEAPPLFDGAEPHHYRIAYSDNSLTLSIDDVPIFAHVEAILASTDGYFGVANYNGWRNRFAVSNIKVR